MPATDLPPPKEHRPPAQPPKRSYAEKLRDPRWQRRRLEVFNAAGWRCQECQAEDRPLAAHHSFYPTGCEPWEVPAELLLCLCEEHHVERQAVEQAIFIAIAKHLAALDLYELRQQDIFTFFNQESTLHNLPAWQRDLLRYERDRQESLTDARRVPR